MNDEPSHTGEQFAATTPGAPPLIDGARPRPNAPATGRGGPGSTPTSTQTAPPPSSDPAGTEATRVAAVIVAAGRGERFGAAGKVLAPLLGRPLLAWTLDAVSAAPLDEIVVVAGEHTRHDISALLASGEWPKVRSLVVGGATRQESVAAGFAAVTAGCNPIVIHDAARPLATPVMFAEGIASARRHGAAIVATPVTDTLKRVVDGLIESTVDRNGLWAAQTPQVFRRQVLAAIADADREQSVTDEAMLCETLGIPVVIVPGSPENLKITHPGDLALAVALLTARGAVNPESPPAPAGVSASASGFPDSTGRLDSRPVEDIRFAAAAPVSDAASGGGRNESSTANTPGKTGPFAQSGETNREAGRLTETGPDRVVGGAAPGKPRWPRTGVGYDAHRLAPGRRLVLGGVEIEHQTGLDGHSDADVLLHAICDGLLGAAGLGDIGMHFPPGDARFKNADSRELLRESVRLLAVAGWEPVNIDATLIAEAPRIAPHVPAMRAVVAALLGVDTGAVSIKATTNETMGFVGRQEGMAAIATALIAPRDGN